MDETQIFDGFCKFKFSLKMDEIEVFGFFFGNKENSEIFIALMEKILQQQNQNKTKN